MRIPTRFTIINRDYKVVDTPPNKEDPPFGQTFFDEAKIELNKVKCGKDRNILEHTFLHELIHVLLNALGHEKLNDDEAFVDSLAAVLHQYMKTHAGDFDDEYLYSDIPY